LKPLEIKSPLRAESLDSITLAKSFIKACESDNMSIFVDALNVWHERPPEGDPLGCSSDNTDGRLPLCTVKRAAVLVHLVLSDEIDGADGYTTTPVGPSQLVIRLDRSLMSRENTASSIATYTFGECEIDFAKMTACRAGKRISVTTLEFKLLKYFLDNAERVLSRAELLDEVWGYDCYPTTRSVDNLILKLRQKLERSPAEPRHLHTVYGAGYKFVP
jgi:hypothetical protein